MRVGVVAIAACAWLGACSPTPTNLALPQDPGQRSRGALLTVPAPAEGAAVDPLASVAPAADGWYDASALLVALRPGLRPAIGALAGVQRLEQLPLYDLRLQLDPLAGTFELEQEVYFTNTVGERLEELVFRVYANVAGKTKTGQPRAPKVIVARTGCPDVACETRLETPSVITVRPVTPLEPGARLRVSLSLRGVLGRIGSQQTDLLGASLESLLSLGKEGTGDYGLLSVGDGIALFANGSAVLARRTPQGWDRAEGSSVGDIGSDEMANVRARVELPAGVEAATTGSVASVSLVRSPSWGSSRVLHVAAPMVRDFTVIAGQGLASTSRSVGEVVVRSTYRPAGAAAGARVAETASQALEVFERRFGAYPYLELDVCEAALLGGAGGVEFSGLVAIASMFYQQGSLGALQGLLKDVLGEGLGDLGELTGPMLEFVTVHEVAHQWWHGLVGSDSRQHPWLDESLAQYSTVLFFEDRDGAEQARRVADQNVRLNYQMMRMMGIADGPVERATSAFGSSMAYAGLVYGKGPYFYEHARKLLGDAAFFEALRSYVQAWQFRTAPSDGPVSYLAKGPREKEVRALARRWWKETHGDRDLGRGDMASIMGTMLGGQGQGLGLGAGELKQLLELLKTGTGLLEGF
jgi:hypothetical protein